MPRDRVHIDLDHDVHDVFALLHDYDRRLDWDSMLSDARIVDGSPCAARGVRTLCTGTWRTFKIAVETAYVSFDPGKVAAVRLTNRPPWFDHFAASIRHRDLGGGRSRVTYTFSFRARPRWLAWLLEPVIAWQMAAEVRHRLGDLSRYLDQRKLAAKTAPPGAD